MKITALEGSPNKHGSSNLLAESFIKGAMEAGHTVEIIEMQPMPISIPAESVCAAAMKVHVFRRTIWKNSEIRYFPQT